MTDEYRPMRRPDGTCKPLHEMVRDLESQLTEAKDLASLIIATLQLNKERIISGQPGIAEKLYEEVDRWQERFNKLKGLWASDK